MPATTRSDFTFSPFLIVVFETCAFKTLETKTSPVLLERTNVYPMSRTINKKSIY